MSEMEMIFKAMNLFDVEPGDFADEISNPIADLFRTSAYVNTAGDLSKANWSDELGGPSQPVKRTTSPSATTSAFAKGSLGCALGVVRTEQRVIDGLTFNVGFDADGVEVGSLLISE